MPRPIRFFDVHVGMSLFAYHFRPRSYSLRLPPAADEEQGIYGSERALEALNRAKDASPHDLLEYVKSEVRRFEGNAPGFDDLTLLCLEYKGPVKPDGDPENDRKTK